jgi:hypothetical protein
MLTAAQRAKCQRIAEALDRGERVSLDSFSAAERGEIWDQRAHVKQLAARHKMRQAAENRNVSPRRQILSRIETALRSFDLDYWGVDQLMPPRRMPPKPMPVRDDPPMPGDDDDEDSPPVLPDHEDDDDAPEDSDDDDDNDEEDDEVEPDADFVDEL